jgi:hypothetical protein
MIDGEAELLAGFNLISRKIRELLLFVPLERLIELPELFLLIWNLFLPI